MPLANFIIQQYFHKDLETNSLKCKHQGGKCPSLGFGGRVGAQLRSWALAPKCKLPFCFNLKFFKILFLAAKHVGSQFPNQTLKPNPLHWTLGVLTTGLPEKSHYLLFSFLLSFLFFPLSVSPFPLTLLTLDLQHGLQR